MTFEKTGGLKKTKIRMICVLDISITPCCYSRALERLNFSS
jgi:hypothetical protein